MNRESAESGRNRCSMCCTHHQHLMLLIMSRFICKAVRNNTQIVLVCARDIVVKCIELWQVKTAFKSFLEGFQLSLLSWLSSGLSPCAVHLLALLTPFKTNFLVLVLHRAAVMLLLLLLLLQRSRSRFIVQNTLCTPSRRQFILLSLNNNSINFFFFLVDGKLIKL